MGNKARQITKAKGRLTQRVTDSSTSIKFTSVDSTRALTSVTMSDFGDIGYLVINPKGTAENYAVVSFTGWSVSSNEITISGVTFLELEGTGTSSASYDFAAGTDVIITDNHHWLDNFVDLGSAQTIDGVKTFSSVPVTTGGNPTSNNELANKAYVDAQATGTATVNRVIVPGNAGETVAAGDWVYLDTADNEWKKTDATTSSTIERVELGIAQGAGTDGNAITGGVLKYGVDNNQSGLTPDTLYYYSDTAGEVSTSPGTVEREAGMAISATEILMTPNSEYIITEDEKDALAGTSGTPSNTNRYVTDDDTATTSTADAVVRATSNGYINNNWLNGALFSSFGDGSDGALNVTSGTTTIDAASANVVEKNYTSINISAGATLDLSNKAANGTILWLKSQGDVTISGTIDLAGDGADGGNGATTGAPGNATAGTNAFSLNTNNGQNTGGGRGISTSSASGGSGGGGGASIANDGQNGQGGAESGGTGGTNDARENTLNVFKITFNFYIAVGAGGGGGGEESDESGNGGDGGSGGGAVVIMCGGELIFDGIIDVSGEDGEDAGATISGANGGGGGGAGGTAILIAQSIGTNTGTFTLDGGAGGSGTGDGGGADGGDGGDGDSLAVEL